MEFLYYEMVSFLPKEFALVEEQQRQNPHETGASLLVGWLAKEKVLTTNTATGYFELDWEKFVSSVDQFYTLMTEFSARGNLEEFKLFLNEQIEAIPDELSEVKEELNKERIHSVHLVNRGDLYGVEE